MKKYLIVIEPTQTGFLHTPRIFPDVFRQAGHAKKWNTT